MTEAIFPSLLHQDPRYFRKVNGPVKSRLLYASTRILVTRTDSGKWWFNASEFIGNGTVASIGNWYYPDARGFGPTMQRMFTQIGTDTISNVLKEFWPDIKRNWFHKGDNTAAADYRRSDPAMPPASGERTGHRFLPVLLSSSS